MPNLKVSLNGDELTPEINAQILAKLDEVRQLMPFAVGLSSRERLTFPALGRKGTQFVQRAVESMRMNSALVPAYVDISTVENAYGMYNNLLEVVESIQQLERLAMDTMHIAGNLSRNQSLEFYHTVKRGSKANVPGAQAVYENLKTRFEKTSRSADLAKNVKTPEQAPE
jgi:hypothetical protein